MIDILPRLCYTVKKLKGVFIMAKRKNELIASILYIAIGVILAIFRSETLGWAMTIAGVFFIVSGALELVKKTWVGGAVSMIIGIAILVLGWVAVEIVLIVLGVLLAIKGIVALINVFTQKGRHALEIIAPILTILIGIALAFGDAFGTSLGNGRDIIILVVGILLAVDGVLGLIGSLQKAKN